MLETAKKAGTRLIIAVNDDAYCRRIKRPTRSIQPDEIRVMVAAGIVEAHAATTVPADTPEDLIRGIRPHLYLLGSDYRGREIPGSDHCEQVEYRERLPGFSTTGLTEIFLILDAG